MFINEEVLLVPENRSVSCWAGTSHLLSPCPAEGLSCPWLSLQAKEKELMEFSKEVSEARSSMDIAQAELELYLSKYNSAVARLNQAQEALGSTSNTLKERKASIKDIAGKLPQAEQQLKEVSLGFPVSFWVTHKAKPTLLCGNNHGENKP